MKQLSIKMKLQYYLLTFAVIVVLFIIEDPRPIHHMLDSPLVYGELGYIILLTLILIISIYLGIGNAYRKWLYPLCIALFAYLVVPYVSVIFMTQPEVIRYFLNYFWFFGFSFIFIPLMAVSFFGIGIGYMIRKTIKY